MAKLWYVAWVMAAMVFLAVPASGEFYKYRDQNGVLRFTDNLAEVPPDQRPKVTTYEGAQTSADSPPGPSSAPSASEEKAAAISGAGDQAREDIEEERQRLEQVKQTLDKEREELARKKEELKEERKQLRDEQDARAYNKKVQELNESIAAYEQRRKAFQEQVEALNARQK